MRLGVVLRSLRIATVSGKLKTQGTRVLVEYQGRDPFFHATVKGRERLQAAMAGNLSSGE